MSGEDRDLEYLMAKKMRELKRKLASPSKKEPSDRDMLLSRLVDRGDEVLQNAERTYPKETSIIVSKLLELMKKGTIRGYITGGELLALFRALGIRIHIETTISVEKDGKLIPLAESLRQKNED